MGLVSYMAEACDGWDISSARKSCVATASRLLLGCSAGSTSRYDAGSAALWSV